MTNKLTAFGLALGFAGCDVGPGDAPGQNAGALGATLHGVDVGSGSYALRSGRVPGGFGVLESCSITVADGSGRIRGSAAATITPTGDVELEGGHVVLASQGQSTWLIAMLCTSHDTFGEAYFNRASAYLDLPAGTSFDLDLGAFSAFEPDAIELHLLAGK